MGDDGAKRDLWIETSTSFWFVCLFFSLKFMLPTLLQFSKILVPLFSSALSSFLTRMELVNYPK